ncbi:MAG TPA: phosphotransferase [Gaiellaceae bacterium]
MRSKPVGLEDEAVVEALRRWGFEASVAEYVPMGAGSHHWRVTDAAGARRFVTVDDLDSKTWLGDTRDASFGGLRLAFDTAVALRQGGLDFVVAPLPTSEGDSLLRLGSRHTLALFPFVDGRGAEFGAHDEESRKAALAMVAELHRATTGPDVSSVGLELPGRRHLEAALRDVDEPWTDGPLSEPARAAIRRGASELAELLGLADVLAAEARSHGGAWVVTHGEPHAANIMRTGDAWLLVDWDTVALAPPERDLWMLVDDADENAARDYFGTTGRQIDQTALDYFRLAWDLKDLAEYLNVLRAPHEENEDTARELGALGNCAAIREAWAARLDR